MANSRKDKQGSRFGGLLRRLRGEESPRRRAVLAWVGWIVLIVGLGAGAGVGLRRLERQVMTNRTIHVPAAIRVQIMATPGWMPVPVAQELSRELTPAGLDFHDEKAASAVFGLGQSSPWVRRMIRVRKRLSDDPRVGLIEVEAEYRQPIAKVLHDGAEHFVDAQAVRLPAEQVPRWAVRVRPAGEAVRLVCFVEADELPPAVQAESIHYIAIDGVAAVPPPVGQPWQGQDVAAALRLIRLVCTRPYANQVTVVDVRNHGGRISRSEPQLRMYAQVGRGRRTDIRFGRFPVPEGGDYEVAPERKMSYLDTYAQEKGGLLAGMNEYIDLRFDELRVSID